MALIYMMGIQVLKSLFQRGLDKQKHDDLMLLIDGNKEKKSRIREINRIYLD